MNTHHERVSPGILLEPGWVQQRLGGWQHWIGPWSWHDAWWRRQIKWIRLARSTHANMVHIFKSMTLPSRTISILCSQGGFLQRALGLHICKFPKSSKRFTYRISKTSMGLLKVSLGLPELGFHWSCSTETFPNMRHFQRCAPLSVTQITLSSCS